MGFASSFLRGLFDPAKLQDTIKSTLLYSPVHRKSIFTDTKLFTFYRIYSKIIKFPIELFDFVWYLKLERQLRGSIFYVFPTDIHMECNQSCCCHSHNFLPKKKKPPEGDFPLIISHDLINASRLSPIFSAFITAQTSRNTAAIVAIPRTTRISSDCHRAFTMQ